MNRDQIGYYLDRLGVPLRKRELLVFDKELEPAMGDFTPIRDGYSVRRISAEDLAQLQYLNPCGWLERHEALDWIANRPCMMIAAIQGSEIVGYCWVEHRDADLGFFDMRVALAPEAVYVSKVAVKKGMRGAGVGKALVGTALVEAVRAGFRRATIACVPTNHAMQGVLRVQQWSYFQSVKYLRAAWVRLYRIATVSEAGHDPESCTFFRAKAAARSVLVRNGRVD
jgi:GNAT superfamily N-acetyltransferase